MMRRFIHLICLAAYFSSIICNVRSYGDKWYRAGVVEYGTDNILTQLKGLEKRTYVSNLYINIIGNAKKEEVDIIVFPEFGINRISVRSVPHPDQNIVPCYSQSGWSSELLQNISCAAKNANMYVVINILEEECGKDDDGDQCLHSNFYNTNVVFDRNGMVVARYRKFNLFPRETKDRCSESEAEISVFETEFGRFGTFICLDLLYRNPSIRLVKEQSVTDVAFTSCYSSPNRNDFMLPIAAGWARVHDVNLLMSGCGSQYIAGSGVFAGADGPFSIPPASMIQLVIAKVQTTKCRRNGSCNCESKLEKVIPFTSDENFDKNSVNVYETQLNPNKSADFYNNTEINGESITTLYYNSDNFTCRISFTVQITAADSVMESYFFFGAQEEMSEYCGVMKTLMTSSNNTQPNPFASLELKTTSKYERKPWPITYTLNQRLPLTGSAYEYQTSYSEGIRMTTMKLMNTDEDIQLFYLLNIPRF